MCACHTMCTCHTNHSVGCIKERIKLPVRKYVNIYINLETVDYCNLFNQTFYGLLFSYLNITHVTSHVHHKFPVSFCCTSPLIVTVSSSSNALISETKK